MPEELLERGTRTLQSTLLLQRQEQMAAVQGDLDRMRIEFDERMEVCRARQLQLKEKQEGVSVCGESSWRRIRSSRARGFASAPRLGGQV